MHSNPGKAKYVLVTRMPLQNRFQDADCSVQSGMLLVSSCLLSSLFSFSCRYSICLFCHLERYNSRFTSTCTFTDKFRLDNYETDIDGVCWLAGGYVTAVTPNAY